LASAPASSSETAPGEWLDDALNVAPMALKLSWHLNEKIGDVLTTEPARLHKPTLLPGDQAALSCPVLVDLSRVLSLSDAVDLSLCTHPQIQGAWVAIKIQAAAVGEAKAAYWPTMQMSIGRQSSETIYPDSEAFNSKNQGNQVNATLNWRLFDFGARQSNRAAAQQTLQAAMAGHDVALQKVFATVIGNYFDAITAQAQKNSREQMLELAQNTLVSTQKRQARGVASLSDTLQASAAVAKARLAAQRAQTDYRKALSVLAFTIGAPAQTALTLPDKLDEAALDSRQELQAWLTQAQDQHPAIVSAQAQLAAAQAKVVVAKSEGMPTVDANASRYVNGYPSQGLSASGQQTTNVGVVLNIPIFQGFGNTYKVRGAIAQAEQSEVQLKGAQDQVMAEIAIAYNEAVASVGYLESTVQLLRATEDAMKSAERRYAGGAADVLELINTQSMLAEAHQERIRAQSEWRSNRLRLLATAGTLGREKLAN
jgi:outer membrane protein